MGNSKSPILNFPLKHKYMISVYSWTYNFDKSSERNKEETMFEEKYLKVNDKCFKTQWSISRDYKKCIKFCYGGGV